MPITLENLKALKDPSAHHLACTVCGEKYSANPSDYFFAEDGYVFECCDTPNVLQSLNLPEGEDIASEVYERMVAFIAQRDVPRALAAAGLSPLWAGDCEAVKSLSLPTVDLASAVASVSVDQIIQDVVAFSKSRAAQ